MEQFTYSSEEKKKAALGSLGTVVIGIVLMQFFGLVGDVLGFVFVVAGIGYLLENQTWKLEYDDQKVKKSSIFKTTEIYFEDVANMEVGETRVGIEKRASKLIFNMNQGESIEVQILHLDTMTKGKVIKDLLDRCNPIQ